MQLTLSLVDGVRSPAMRLRHWKQVVRFASPSALSDSNLLNKGGSFNSLALDQLSLKELMALQLDGETNL